MINSVLLIAVMVVVVAKLDHAVIVAAIRQWRRHHALRLALHILNTVYDLTWHQ